MASAKIQPYCKKHNINLREYDPKQKMNQRFSLKERRACLYIHRNHFCVMWETINITFTDTIKEVEKNLNMNPIRLLIAF